MNGKKYVIAMDQGTTSSRAILFNKAGEIISVVQREYRQIYPQPGWVEHDPMDIWSTQMGVTMEAMQKVDAKPEEIAAKRPSSGMCGQAVPSITRSSGSAAARPA